VIDGVVVAYPQGRDEIEHAWAILNGKAQANPGELSFPNYMPSHAGDFVIVSTWARGYPGARHRLGFRERDDYTGQTAGYHFKQLLIDGKVVWEEDVAGGTNAWRTISLDATEWLDRATNVSVAFRLLDKKGVGNFGVRWQIADLHTVNVEFGTPLSEPRNWKVSQQGEFEAGFGDNLWATGEKFHVPFIVMTAAQPIEFRIRHGDPTTPERIGSWLSMCLQACRDGKCDGVVTYCLDKSANSPEFPVVRKLFQEVGKTGK